jgi:hypothetical protein
MRYDADALIPRHAILPARTRGWARACDASKHPLNQLIKGVVMSVENTYRIVDHTGIHLAEVKFHDRLDEGLHPVYLQDICESMSAYGYAMVRDFELSGLGKLIAD